MMKTIASLLLAGALAACATQAEVHYSGDASTPELVAMDGDPSVMVVANADEPTFYTGQTYYLYRDRQWYRSSSHRHGWTRTDQPPVAVQRIDRPTRYVHYRHAAGAPRTTYNQHPTPIAPPADRPMAPGPVAHDHRDEPLLPTGPNLQPPRPEAPPLGAPPPAANPLPPNQVPPAAPPDAIH